MTTSGIHQTNGLPDPVLNVFQLMTFGALHQYVQDHLEKMGFPDEERGHYVVLLAGVVGEDLVENGLHSHFLDINVKDFFDSASYEDIAREILIWDWDVKAGLADPRYHKPKDLGDRIANIFYSVMFAWQRFRVHTIEGKINPYRRS